MSGRTIRWILTCAALCGTILCGQMARAQSTAPATTAALRVLAFGDSNSDSGPRARSPKWPEMLAKREPGWVVINRSLGARSLANEPRERSMADAVAVAMRDGPYDAIVISLGTVDVRADYFTNGGAKRVAEGLRVLVRQIREQPRGRNAAIVLCNPLPVFDAKLPEIIAAAGYRDADKRLQEVIPQFALVAQELGLTILDLHTSFAGAEADFEDGLHPGEATQGKIALLMREAVLQAIKDKPATPILPTLASQPATNTTTTAVVAAEDKSLTADEYAKRNWIFASETRQWSTAELEKAVSLLEKAAAVEVNRQLLPRWNSAKSGKIFARLTIAESLKLMREKSTPLTTRYARSSEYFDILPRIAAAYGKASRAEGAFDREQAELQGSLLELTAVMLELGEQMRTELPPNDSRMNAYKPRMDRVEQGAGALVATTLDYLADSNHFRPESRAALADDLATTLPRILPALPEKTRKEIPTQIKNLLELAKDAGLREALGRLLEKVGK